TLRMFMSGRIEAVSGPDDKRILPSSSQKSAIFPERRATSQRSTRRLFNVAIRDDPQTLQSQIRMNCFYLGKLSRNQLRIPTRRNNSRFAPGKTLPAHPNKNLTHQPAVAENRTRQHRVTGGLPNRSHGFA